MKKAISILLAVIMSFSLVFTASAYEIANENYVVVTFTLDGTDKRLAVTDDSGDRGKLLTVSDTGKTDRWILKNALESYNIVNVASGMNIDINGAFRDAGRTILQWDNNGGSNQLWQIEESDGEKVYIYSPYSEMYLTYDEEKGITQEKKDETKSQKWIMKGTGEVVESGLSKAMKSDGFELLSDEYAEKLMTYLGGDGYISGKSRNAAESYMDKNGYFEADASEQERMLCECGEQTYAWSEDRGYATVLEHSIERLETIEEDGVWVWYEQPSEHVWKTQYKVTWSTGEEHTFTYVSVLDNTDPYGDRVADGLGYLPYSIASRLETFYFSDNDEQSWNGGDGQVWNNTHVRGTAAEAADTLAHELGHVIDDSTICEDSFWTRAMARDAVPTTEYGKTNRWEDLAEFSAMFLEAVGDEERMAEIEELYPNRVVAFKALLYHTDSEYFSEYKDEYDETIAETNRDISLEMGGYYTVELDGKALMYENMMSQNETGGLILAENTDAACMQWMAIFTDGGFVLQNRASGAYLCVPSSKGGAEMVASYERMSVFTEEDGALFTVENGLTFAAEDGVIVQHLKDSDSEWTFTIKGKNEDYTPCKIMLGGKALAVKDGALTLASGDEGAQDWLVMPDENGETVIQNIKTGLCLDVSGGSTDEGGKVIAYGATGGDNQIWTVTETEGGVTFTAKHSGLSLALDTAELVQKSAGDVFEIVKE